MRPEIPFGDISGIGRLTAVVVFERSAVIRSMLLGEPPLKIIRKTLLNTVRILMNQLSHLIVFIHCGHGLGIITGRRFGKQTACMVVSVPHGQHVLCHTRLKLYSLPTVNNITCKVVSIGKIANATKVVPLDRLEQPSVSVIVKCTIDETFCFVRTVDYTQALIGFQSAYAYCIQPHVHKAGFQISLIFHLVRYTAVRIISVKGHLFRCHRFNTFPIGNSKQNTSH